MTKQERIDIIKHHITNIIFEEQKKYKTSLEFFIFDKKDYLEDSMLKKLGNKYDLIRNKKYLKKILGYTGYFNFTKYVNFYLFGGSTDGKKITIFLNDLGLKKDFNEQVYFKILATFHEFRHVGQKEKFNIENIEKPITDFNCFRYLIEDNCYRNLHPSYTFAHDDFFFEIDANLYGIEKADEYCAKYDISAVEYQRKYKQKHYSKMLTYDFDKFININSIISVKPTISNKLQKNRTYCLFFNEIGDFNKLSDIVKNPLFSLLEDRLKMELLASRKFLSEINYDLNDFEINLLLENIDNKLIDLINNYNKNMEFYEIGLFKENKFYENSFSLLSKMEYLLNFKLYYKKVNNNNIDLSHIKVQKQIKNISTMCELNNGYVLSYYDKESLNIQLNNIISTFNNFLVDSNNLHDIKKIYSAIKILKEAILVRIDVVLTPVDIQYEQVSKEVVNKNNSVQNDNLDITNNNQQEIYINANNIGLSIPNNTNNSYVFLPENNVKISQIDSSKVRKKV